MTNERPLLLPIIAPRAKQLDAMSCVIGCSKFKRFSDRWRALWRTDMGLPLDSSDP